MSWKHCLSGERIYINPAVVIAKDPCAKRLDLFVSPIIYRNTINNY